MREQAVPLNETTPTSKKRGWNIYIGAMKQLTQTKGRMKRIQESDRVDFFPSGCGNLEWFSLGFVRFTLETGERTRSK